MRNRPDAVLVFLAALTGTWCVALPFLWAHNLHRLPAVAEHMSYAQVLALYTPELVVGAVVLVCLPLVFMRHRFAITGLLFAATLAPTLELALGSPSDAGWPVSVALLVLLSWRLHWLATGDTGSTG